MEASCSLVKLAKAHKPSYTSDSTPYYIEEGRQCQLSSREHTDSSAVLEYGSYNASCY